VGLTTEEIAELLRASMAAIKAETLALRLEHLAWRPGETEWSVNEVVGHLIEAERRGFAGRILQILDQEQPGLDTWDPPAVAAARRDHERDGHELLGELEEMRRESVALVRRLDRAQLERRGFHPEVGELAVRDLLHEWVHHDRNHLQQIQENVKLLVWPHMGNARRFSRPDL